MKPSEHVGLFDRSEDISVYKMESRDTFDPG